ncbi:MAG: dihydroorotase [Gammaproteobacteria bacterium]|nr:dihydroorotase [Gammaproteobacteria bacterium]MCW8922115.1 dihydroorotase [Gammaproteobacteria bacterium]
MKQLQITRPDDWHVHLRDNDMLNHVAPFTAQQFARAIVMPNLQPPVTTVKLAVEYVDRIINAVNNDRFEPLMTLYLTDDTSAEEIILAEKSCFVKALKLYPAGATTNSSAGVTDIRKCDAALAAMEETGLPLLVHGEVTAPEVDVFDREKVFIDQVLMPLMNRFPKLKIVFEHITTADAVEFVLNTGLNIGATITPQHLLLNRNAIFKGGLRPHNYCLPVLKREQHRQALLHAATSGHRKFFLGTDSAPHTRDNKESGCGCAGIFSAHAAIEMYATAFEQQNALDKLEAFASFNGPDFYGLSRNTETVTLERTPWVIPDDYPLASGETLVPMMAGETINWKLIQ